jgi:hypothetical protein
MADEGVVIHPEGTVLDGLVVKLFKGVDDEFRWSAYAADGRKLADAGESYREQKHAANSAHELFPTAEINAVDGNPWLFEGKQIT